MTIGSTITDVPQDLVSIFHCSFHPTKGNIVDWALRSDENLDLTNVEFSSLPSGLHLVEEDVVYFTKDDHQGVSVFRRRETSEKGHRGFRLSSLGVLLAKSSRPRPWRHVPSLKLLIRSMYLRFEEEGIYDPERFDWSPAESFFEQRKNSRANPFDSGTWRGWSDELDSTQPNPDLYNPTIHLPHLLRILGLSTITLYKHVLGRKRILIYTLPPVEASGILCQVAADMCYEDQVDYDPSLDQRGPPVGLDTGGSRIDGSSLRLKGRTRESIRVFGMVTLSDLDMLQSESDCKRGWVACTTDAIYLEKPSLYDLVIDLTTSTPSKNSRPTLYLSRPTEWTEDGSGRNHKLSQVRFTWSDVKVWAELERLLARHVTDDHNCCEPYSKTTAESSWGGIWRVYEDVCIICAGLWVGAWRNNSAASYSTVNGSMANWGQVRLEGDDDLSVGGSYVRNLGMGIEGRPAAPSDLDREDSGASGSSRMAKRASGTSAWSKFTNKDTDDRPIQLGNDEQEARLRKREQQTLLTLALLQTFHAHTTNLLSKLSYYLPGSPAPSSGDNLSTIYLSPRDLYAFELGPLSGLDAQFIEWLGEEYGSRVGVRVIVRRGWKDLARLVLGF